MIEINKTEGYRVVTYKGKILMGSGDTEKEALEDYLERLNKSLVELEENTEKLKECKKEAEELLIQIK